MAPKGKKPAPNPLAKKKAAAKSTNPLYEKRPKNFGVGGSLPVRKDLSRFVKRLKVPPTINQFNKTLDKNVAENLFKLLGKYRPEDKAAKKERLLAEAAAQEKGQTVDKKKPVVIKYGLNHVTQLIEAGKAQLVVIAHDVDPIELVLWLPTLCKKMDVPYCTVKGKSRLGQLVHQKNAAALCLTSVKSEDQREFGKIVEAARSSFNDGARVQWGGGIMGAKNRHKMKVRAKILAKELAQRSVVA